MPDPAASPEVDRVFSARYERLAPALCVWVWRHASRTLRARIEVEDVLQEVWLRALRAHAEFRGGDAEFRSWIFAIAKLVLLELGRSAQRLQRFGLGDGATSRQLALQRVEASITRLSQRLVRDEALRAFRDHLAALPREDQELVSYCGLEGAACAEAARKLGIGVEAAQKRWQRLRAKLREEGFAHDWIG